METIVPCKDPIEEYAKKVGISNGEAAMMFVSSNEDLVKSLKEAEKELRQKRSG